ncbi:hypothetical protein BDN72DRAFT_65894 [Pluteus cervinus]|uniref:Uncharacterized protein n=1 Tax=Pluteus cervinus TaxID=181527 RepID=A0ACD3APV1_9AGAR|nr:hypothetical protein BDN72DRAFT_65894 [Pluteus cervinus]
MASVNDTLHFITSIKLQELQKQQAAYEQHIRVLDDVRSLDDASVEKVEKLFEAVKSWRGPGATDDESVIGDKLVMDGFPYWLRQAKQDPDFDPTIVRGWTAALQQHLHQVTRRFDCAKLFGEITNEWLTSTDSPSDATSADQGIATPTEEFLDLGRKEKVEQKDRFSSLVFEEQSVDTAALLGYLNDLFTSKDAIKVLEDAREAIGDYCKSLDSHVFTVNDVRNAITGLLSGASLDDKRSATLKTFQENPTVLAELASVMTMRLSSLDSWAWPSSGLEVEFRRFMNGKYRALTEPEIVDALLLQHIGITWQIRLKQVFGWFIERRSWKRSYSALKPEDRNKIGQQTQQFTGDAGSIEVTRHQYRKQHFFLCQLTDTPTKPNVYGDDGDRPRNPSYDLNEVLSGMQVKEKLLHIMATETVLNKTLHNTHTVVRSDFEWFGPSLPHDAILTIFEFFGMTPTWLKFLRTWLQAPLRFKDDPAGVTRIRKRGTPISYALSSACGEAIMFVMDFAVNQRASGLFLYRIHDDLWLWDKDSSKCAAAWVEMKRYADLVKIKFNSEKTGSATFGSDRHPDLPDGSVRWGFLAFSETEGRLVIAQEDVDTHIKEMKRQLEATKSIFGWVNLYNKYMGFFLRNFGGPPVKCFGQEHVDDVIKTLVRIHKELFPHNSGGAVGYLRSVIQQKFSVKELPEGYFYLPLSMGGLGLKNPYVDFFALEEESTSSVAGSEMFAKLMKEDEENYRNLKETWTAGVGAPPALPVYPLPTAATPSPYAPPRGFRGRGRATRFVGTTRPVPGATTTPILPYYYPFGEFMSFEEYTNLREIWLVTWGQRYADMLQPLPNTRVKYTPSVASAIDNMDGAPISIHDRWTMSVYGDGLLQYFGSMEVVDPNLIPVGMVKLFQGSRTKLDE